MVKKFDDPITAMQAVAELRHRTKIVELDNFKVTLRTLGTKDETDTFINCMHLWGQAFIYKHKIETLIFAIVQINGMSLDGVNEESKRAVIEKWSQDIVDELYLEYAKMIGSLDNYLQKIQLTAETNVVGAKDAETKQKAIKTDSNEGDENVN